MPGTEEKMLTEKIESCQRPKLSDKAAVSLSSCIVVVLTPSCP